ncbi:MAG: lysylphosphatidylglycerol synthase transmembrane domain-containing protein [Gemmatimonadaceae bacterium]
MTLYRGRITRLAVLAVIAVALVAFARTIDWAETWQAIRGTSPLLFAAAALVNLLSLVLKGARWWVFLRPIGVASLWLAIRATFVGAGLNNLLIASGGDAARVVYVARSEKASSAAVLATLALERLFELVGYVVLLALAVSFLQVPVSLGQTRPLAIVSLAVILGLLVYLIRYPAQSGVAVLEGEGLLHRARLYGGNFARTLTGISTAPRFAVSLAISVIVWALQVASYQLTALAAGFSISLVGTITALLAVNLGFAVRATPGNIGVFQMLYVMTAVGLGLDPDQATGVALLIQAQQILPVTLLGLIASPGILGATRRLSAG